MSVMISAAVWRMQFQDTSLKLVALALADQANDEGECWPYLESVAARVELSERSVQRHLSTLEANGLLEREARFSRKGTQTSNMFRFNLEAIPAPSVTNKPAKKDEKTADPIQFPHGEKFAAKWEEWQQFKKGARHKKLQPASVQKQLDALGAIPEPDAIDCIDLSIRNGWQGLFPERFGKGGKASVGNRRADGTLNKGSSFGRRDSDDEGHLF